MRHSWQLLQRLPVIPCSREADCCSIELHHAREPFGLALLAVVIARLEQRAVIAIVIREVEVIN